MDVMIVPPPLALPADPTDLAALEAQVLAWGQAAMRQALAEAFAAQEARRAPAACPACGEAGTRPAAARARWRPVEPPSANPVAAAAPVHFNKSRRETAELGVRGVIARSSSTLERPIHGTVPKGFGNLTWMGMAVKTAVRGGRVNNPVIGGQGRGTILAGA